MCSVLSEVCVPLAGRRIARLQLGEGQFQSSDELMIEFELCIGLIFKPLRHHLQTFQRASLGGLSSVWKSVLRVLEEMLRSDGRTTDSSPEKPKGIPDGLKATMHNLANEHLRNAIVVLMSAGVIESDAKPLGDITSATIESVSRMGISEGILEELKQASSSS